MSNKKLLAGEGVLIGRDHWDVPVRVELRSVHTFQPPIGQPVTPIGHSLGPRRIAVGTRGPSLYGPAGSARPAHYIKDLSRARRLSPASLSSPRRGKFSCCGHRQRASRT